MITISTDKSLLDINTIYNFITEAYWAKGRTIEEVQKTIDNCFCFGAYLEGKQIGFARICTDYTVFAYIMDVFILPEHRGKGYSKQLMDNVLNDSELQSCTVWMLKTSDAHGLYKQYGFTDLKHPEKVMEKIIK
ncbi:GNAT family N-acetyltransferase [Aureibaculum sp. A20]|uniref:GNAT family N-acetyltransferase n=1 Tax=Aureibaculum flavum TaxID=2795986 RepID=A0ABS0WSA1_9FLAO|nr:GNAT family N-acetyltransferase [Aureibaculum flavum]MBJ2174856.1 GNAT family N-acetyltransferase [Aureibaculum flavum]